MVNVILFEGFSMFHPYDANEENDLIFFLIMEQERPIGALCIEKEEGNPFYEINYVEVHSNYRGKGISRRLYQVLNDWVQPDTIIIGSDMTLAGRKAGLHRIRNEVLTNGMKSLLTE
jgi:GNAT superfamily N-acetyltransferase